MLFFPVDDRGLYGPLGGSESSQYPFYAGVGALSMFCNVGLLFLIAVLLYWWLGTAKEKRKQWLEPTDEEADDSDEDDDTFDEESADEDDGEFSCTTCGAPVSATHNFCPSCGEKFDGIEKIKDDGTIVYTDKTYSAMKELGYDCKELSFDEMELRSEELETVRKKLQN